MKISSCFKDKKNIKVIYWVMVLLQLALIVYCFACKREGWHQDEVSAYGFANSYYCTTLYYSDEDGNQLINYEQWIDKKTITDYLVVNTDQERDERFSYDSVYYNHIRDLSPPLYSMILHTVCSFFPGTYTVWYAFSINIAAFLIAMLFLWKACCEYKDERFALLVGLIYGFSRGCVDTFIYLRMYGMLTALFTIILYYFIKVLKSEEKQIPLKWLICIYMTAFVMFFTHMYPILAAGILTFFVCLFLLCKRQIKKMFQLGFTMLLALGSFIAVYPSSLHNIFYHVGNHVDKIDLDYDFDIKVKTMLNSLFGKVFNIMIPYYESGILKILPYILMYVLIVCMPLLFLVRKNDWFCRIVDKMKKIIKDIKNIFLRWYRNWDWIWIVFFAVLVSACIAISETVNVAFSNVYVDRYVSYLMPAGAVLGVVLVDYFVKKFFGKDRRRFMRRIVVGVLTVVCVSISLLIIEDGSAYYFETKREGIGLAAAAENSNVIVIHRNISRITGLAPYLLESNAFFRTSPFSYMDFSDAYLDKIASGEKVIVILYMEDYRYIPEEISLGEETFEMVVDEEKLGIVLDYFDELVPESRIEYLTSETLVAGEVRAYLINP